METIYQTAIDKVSNGARFSVDFKKRSLRINGKVVDLQKMPPGIPIHTNLDVWLDEVENLYDTYKYSRPSKSSMAKERKAKFRALSVAELIRECGHDALSNPKSRDVAQAELEIFILLSLVNGSFKPEELFAKDWFFQGTDKSFILRKDWF